MTDNARACRWSLREVCTAHDIRQQFIKPHCPWQNGKVERPNHTLTTEWAYRETFTTNHQRAAALTPARARQHSTSPQRTPRQTPDLPAATNQIAGYT